MRNIIILLSALVLVACDEEDTAAEKVVRGLKTFTVSESTESTVRNYPGVIESSEITGLSFEVGGSVGQIDINVGQPVTEGQVIARLDTAALELQVQSAEASVKQASAIAQNAKENLARQEELLTRGATTKVVVDQARTDAESSEASATQAQKSLETAQDNLEKSELTAPFDGIVNSVDATSFSTISAGSPVVTIYRADTFEVSFSVNFNTVNQLVVGTPARVRLADAPDVSLSAVVSEIGSRADAVSSFPIVLQLTETNPILKAGMAVETSIEFPLPAAKGYLIPLAAVIKDGEGSTANGDNPSELGVYLFESASSTVKRKTVTVGGVRQNSIVVLEGLSPGDKIASAGVSFLREGQEVKLLDRED